jgi:hypothetical protein
MAKPNVKAFRSSPELIDSHKSGNGTLVSTNKSAEHFAFEVVVAFPQRHGHFR